MTMDGSAFSELVGTRRSVRDFRPDPIPVDLLQRILDDAKWAPSWTNTQPYLLAIASGEKRDRLQQEYVRLFDASLPVQHGGKFALLKMMVTRRGYPDGDFRTWKPYPKSLQPYRRKIGQGLYTVLGIDRHDQAARDAQWRRNCEFFGAPTVIFVFAHKGLMPFSAQDAGLMLQTLMLSAHANGLGTCAQGVLATWRGPVDAEFDIPKDYKLLTGLAIGYPSDAPVNSFNAGRRDIDQAPHRVEPAAANQGEG
jgi:nitroreductase